MLTPENMTTVGGVISALVLTIGYAAKWIRDLIEKNSAFKDDTIAQLRSSLDEEIQHSRAQAERLNRVHIEYIKALPELTKTIEGLAQDVRANGKVLEKCKGPSND